MTGFLSVYTPPLPPSATACTATSVKPSPVRAERGACVSAVTPQMIPFFPPSIHQPSSHRLLLTCRDHQFAPPAPHAQAGQAVLRVLATGHHVVCQGGQWGRGGDGAGGRVGLCGRERMASERGWTGRGLVKEVRPATPQHSHLRARGPGLTSRRAPTRSPLRPALPLGGPGRLPPRRAGAGGRG